MFADIAAAQSIIWVVGGSSFAVAIAVLVIPASARHFGRLASSRTRIGIQPADLATIGRRFTAPSLVGLALFATFGAAVFVLAPDPYDSAAWSAWAARGGELLRQSLPPVAYFACATAIAAVLGRWRQSGAARVRRRPQLRDFVPLWTVGTTAAIAAAGAAAGTASISVDLSNGIPVISAVISPAPVAAAISLAAVSAVLFGRDVILGRSNRGLPDIWADIVAGKTMAITLGLSLSAAVVAIASGSRVATSHLGLSTTGGEVLFSLGPISSLLAFLLFSSYSLFVDRLVALRVTRALYPADYALSPRRRVDARRRPTPAAEPARILNER